MKFPGIKAIEFLSIFPYRCGIHDFLYAVQLYNWAINAFMELPALPDDEESAWDCMILVCTT
jgi:hypothetical protein